MKHLLFQFELEEEFKRDHPGLTPFMTCKKLVDE